MAKRFTDTAKWNKVWFRKLKPKLKCFWFYITDNCNHAGFWEVDFQLASYLIGTRLDETEIRSEFKKQFKEIDGGKRWFIKDFVEFQYGCLNPNNNAHKSVIELLEKLGCSEGLVCPSAGALDMDMDKDMDKEREKKPHATIYFLEKVPSQDLQELSEKYKITPRGVQSKADDLKLYCESKGKKYKNYRAFLENALRKDVAMLRERFPLPKPVKVEIPEKPATQEELNRRETKMAEIRDNLRGLAKTKTL